MSDKEGWFYFVLLWVITYQWKYMSAAHYGHFLINYGAGYQQLSFMYSLGACLSEH